MRGTMIAALNRPARRSTGGWTPAELSNLELWMRPEDLGADDSLVSSWPDQSGNGRNLTQGTQANQPKVVAGAIDGYKAVSFDGVDDLLSTTFALSQPYSSVVVCTWPQDTVARAMWGGPVAADPFFRTQTGPTIRWGAGSYTNTPVLTGIAAGTWGRVIAYYSGASSALEADFAGDISVTDAANVGTNALTGVTLGFPASSNAVDYDIAELIVTSSEITGEERSSLDAYLASRYSSIGL